MPKLNLHVQRLFGFAETTFGERLTDLLLIGRGESKAAEVRPVVVTYMEGGFERELLIKLTSDHAGGLPGEDQPLVLLALLRLWLTRGRTRSGQLAYRYGEVLEALGWADSERARATVDGAVESYLDMYYRSGDAQGRNNGGEDWKATSVYKLVAGYVFGEEQVTAGDVSTGDYYREVTFNADMLNEMRGKMLFGVDWNSVLSIKPL